MLGYLSGEFDILRAKDLRKLDEMIQKNRERGNEYFAVAIYSRELCEELGMDTPLKSAKDRAQIMEQISGVDFTFIIDDLEEKSIIEKATETFKDFKRTPKEQKTTKKYKTVYVPGTYDLFHAGHLENLMEANKIGEKVIAGVKADELVKKQKGDYPKISAEERMEILRHFKFIDNVYQFYTRDLHVAAGWVESKYGSKPAVVCGADLEKDYKSVEGLDIVYTDRDAKKMKERSTSTYKKKLKLRQIEIPDEEKKEHHFTGNINMALPMFIDEIISVERTSEEKKELDISSKELKNKEEHMLI
ncbi:MAG: adenylyltransferase/cytidyltransferase family protein [Clostridia bacterium]|nr:adenylyltransferase/cytidyltransferase family protein [Clostridia bacterium]